MRGDLEGGEPVTLGHGTVPESPASPPPDCCGLVVLGPPWSGWVVVLVVVASAPVVVVVVMVVDVCEGASVVDEPPVVLLP